MLYGHGDDARQQSREIRDDFSSNIRPDGPPAGLLNHLRTHIDVVAHYPDAGARELADKFATASHVAAAQVLVTAGATAAIYLIAQAFRRKKSLIITPTFSEYEDAAAMHEHALAFATRAELSTLQNSAASADLVWLCEPNNPTGEVFPREQLLALIDAHPRIVFAIDQSYSGFCAAAQLHATDATTRENLILVRSFTKTLGIPGLRLGTLISSTALTEHIARGVQPWSVNALALEAGSYYFAHSREFALPLDDFLSHTGALCRSIAALPSYVPQPTTTNFFLVRLCDCEAPKLKQHLVQNHGILVRDASNFRGLTNRHIRISTQLPWQNNRLIEALRGWKH